MPASTSMPNHPRSLAAPAGDVKHYPRSATRSEQLRRFEAIVCSDPDLMRLLRRIRRIRLPQWRLVAGCLYQTVWNVLTGRPRGTGIRDYDLIYFHEDLSWAAEDAVIRRVAAAARGCVGPVETRNQARVHLWFESRALAALTLDCPRPTTHLSDTLPWCMPLASGSRTTTDSTWRGRLASMTFLPSWSALIGRSTTRSRTGLKLKHGARRQSGLRSPS